MRPSISTAFPIILMGLLAALTFWLERATQIDAAAPAQARHDPDYFVDNFTVQRFDLQGKLQHTVIARHMQHYPDDDSTDVVKPSITFHKNRPTVITADTANIDSGGKTVLLKGNVRSVSQNVQGPPTEVSTAAMTVLTEEEIARTDVPVTITQGLSVMQGTGMLLNNKTRIHTLNGRATGTIAPKQ